MCDRQVDLVSNGARYLEFVPMTEGDDAIRGPPPLMEFARQLISGARREVGSSPKPQRPERVPASLAEARSLRADCLADIPEAVNESDTVNADRAGD
ncbi:hypothetical protein GCM10027447_13960 [Glycomyces halotolerans]